MPFMNMTLRQFDIVQDLRRTRRRRAKQQDPTMELAQTTELDNPLELAMASLALELELATASLALDNPLELVMASPAQEATRPLERRSPHTSQVTPLSTAQHLISSFLLYVLCQLTPSFHHLSESNIGVVPWEGYKSRR